jgi:hypothetical protein
MRLVRRERDKRYSANSQSQISISIPIPFIVARRNRRVTKLSKSTKWGPPHNRATLSGLWTPARKQRTSLEKWIVHWFPLRIVHYELAQSATHSSKRTLHQKHGKSPSVGFGRKFPSMHTYICKVHTRPCVPFCPYFFSRWIFDRVFMDVVFFGRRYFWTWIILVENSFFRKFFWIYVNIFFNCSYLNGT